MVTWVLIGFSVSKRSALSVISLRGVLFIVYDQLCEHMKFNFNPPLCENCEVPIQPLYQIYVIDATLFSIHVLFPK